MRRGRRWWRYDEQNGAISNEGAPEERGGIGAELGWLLDPAPVMGLLELFIQLAPPPRPCPGRDRCDCRACGDDPFGWPAASLDNGYRTLLSTLVDTTLVRGTGLR